MRRSMFDPLIGTTLDCDLHDDYGALVLKSGTKITREIVEKLASRPISERSISQPINYADTISTAIIQVETLFNTARHEHRISLEFVMDQIVPRIIEVTKHPQLNELIQLLHIKDRYTVSHSFAVSVLARLLGKWLNLSLENLDELVIAATLHDIGKAQISEAILNKPGKLTPDEYRTVQQHTVLGYQMIRQTPGLSESMALCALQHHERFDGTGYPKQLKPNEIHYYARIIGVVDVFHAMTSTRVYHKAKPLYQILHEMEEGTYGQFDVAIIRTFIGRIMEGLIGCSVRLSDHRLATIVLVNPIHPTLPLIKTDTEFVDLNIQRHLRIMELC